MRGLKDGFRRFMVGRYGTDELNRSLSVLILVFVVLHLLVRSKVFFWLEVICLVLVYVRMFSRDTGKRSGKIRHICITVFASGNGPGDPGVV